MDVVVAGGGLVDLALLDEVLMDVGLDKESDEVKRIGKLAEVQQQEMVDAYNKHAIEGGDSRLIASKINGKFNAELRKLVTPDQYTRLQQIYWQQLGRRALLETEIAKILELSGEQQRKIEVIDAGVFPAYVKSFPRGNPTSEEDRQVRLKKKLELTELADRMVNEILTVGQQAKFKQLKGRPFLIPSKRLGAHSP